MINLFVSIKPNIQKFTLLIEKVTFQEKQNNPIRKVTKNVNWRSGYFFKLISNYSYNNSWQTQMDTNSFRGTNWYVCLFARNVLTFSIWTLDFILLMTHRTFDRKHQQFRRTLRLNCQRCYDPLPTLFLTKQRS